MIGHVYLSYVNQPVQLHTTNVAKWTFFFCFSKRLTIVKITNIRRILSIVRVLAYDYKEILNVRYFTMLIFSLGITHKKKTKTNSRNI